MSKKTAKEKQLNKDMRKIFHMIEVFQAHGRLYERMQYKRREANATESKNSN